MFSLEEEVEDETSIRIKLNVYVFFFFFQSIIELWRSEQRGNNEVSTGP